jgi:hypothetical protein
LHPGGRLRLNPLDPGSLAADETASEVAARQLRLLTSLAEGALGRPLRPGEHAACQEALQTVTQPCSVPTLPAVVDALLTPTRTAAQRVGTNVQTLARESRDAALALRRLVEGDLAGMFDGPTTEALDLSARMVVLDLTALRNSTALGLLMTCATAALHARLSARYRVKRIVVIDEAWAVLNDLGVARWMQASWKLSRQYGVQHIAVLHRLSDLDAAGAAGSEQTKLARGLLHDTETRVIYGQPDSERPTTSQLLGLSDTQARLLPTLSTGVALWNVGTRSFLVQHRLGRSELPLVHTDAAMADAAPDAGH